MHNAQNIIGNITINGLVMTRGLTIHFCLNHEEDIGVMGHLATSYIKYTDELKAEIIRLCNADKLDELQKLIEIRLG